MSDYSGNHKRLIRLALSSRNVWMILAFLSLLSAATVIVLMYGFSLAVDSVFIGQAPLSGITSILYLLGIAIFFRGILFWLSGISGQYAASQIKADLRNRLLRHLQHLGPSWTERQNSGELSSTAVEGVEKLDNYYAGFIPAAIHMAIVPVTVALFVILTDWISGLILIITGPLIPVFMSLIGMRAQSQTRQQWSTLGRLSSHFLDTVQGLRTLRIFNHDGYKQKEVENISEHFRKSTMGVLKVAFLSGFVLELFASIATALVAVGIGVRLVEGYIGFQAGLFVLLLAPEYYLPFRMFGAQHHAGMEGTEAAGRIFEVLDTPAGGAAAIKDEDTATGKGKGKATGKGKGKGKGKEFPVNGTTYELPELPAPPHEIRFENVCFTYPGNTEPALSNCSFTLDPGRVTAITGKSGSGKTTVTRLLTCQHSPCSGKITINNHPLTTAEEIRWLDHIAMVSQNIWLFDDTVRNNLRIAQRNASDKDLVDAAKASEAHEFIMNMPQKYDTPLGEMATRLSGGERQRIAIARAFLRDASLIILDEPSSALDPESEQKITTALQRLFANRTVLIIAHRLSTIRHADRILLMEKGSIICQGTHRELLSTAAVYRKLVRPQRYPSS